MIRAQHPALPGLALAALAAAALISLPSGIKGKLIAGGLSGIAAGIPAYENSHQKFPGRAPGLEAPAHPPPADNPHREFLEVPMRGFMARSSTPSSFQPDVGLSQEDGRWILRVPRSWLQP